MANRWGNSDSVYFGGAPKSLQMVNAAMKLKDAYDQPKQHIKKQRHYLAMVNDSCTSQHSHQVRDHMREMPYMPQFFVAILSESEVVQSCLTLCDPMDCSLPGSSVHGIFQVRVLTGGGCHFLLQFTLSRFW